MSIAEDIAASTLRHPSMEAHMTAVFAAVELYSEPAEDEGAPALEVAEHLPVTPSRVAAARPGGDVGVLKAIWTGIKQLARAAGHLITIGFLTVTMIHFGRALWREIDQPETGDGGAGKVLRFPGPHLEELS
jgi:hypothetical protein